MECQRLLGILWGECATKARVDYGPRLYAFREWEGGGAPLQVLAESLRIWQARQSETEGLANKRASGIGWPQRAHCQ